MEIDPISCLLFFVGASLIVACFLFAWFEFKSMLFLYGAYVFMKHAIKFYFKM